MTEASAEALSVAIGVPVSVASSDDVAAADPLLMKVAADDAEGQRDELGQGDAEGEGKPLAEAAADRLRESIGEPVNEAPNEADAAALTLADPVALREIDEHAVALALRGAECDAMSLADNSGDPDPVSDDVLEREAAGDALSPALSVPHPLAVAETEGLDEALGLENVERESAEETVARSVKLLPPDALPDPLLLSAEDGEREAEVQALTEVETEAERVMEGQALWVEEAHVDPLEEGVDERAPLALAREDGDCEKKDEGLTREEAEPRAEGESAAVKVSAYVVGAAENEKVAVGVREGDGEEEGEEAPECDCAGLGLLDKEAVGDAELLEEGVERLDELIDPEMQNVALPLFDPLEHMEAQTVALPLAVAPSDPVAFGEEVGEVVLLEEADGAREDVDAREGDDRPEVLAVGAIEIVTFAALPVGEVVLLCDTEAQTVALGEAEPRKLLVAFPEAEKVPEDDTVCVPLATDAVAQDEEEGDCEVVGDIVGTTEEVALTVELLLGAEEKLVLKEELPEKEAAGEAEALPDTDDDRLEAAEGD